MKKFTYLIIAAAVALTSVISLNAADNNSAVKVLPSGTMPAVEKKPVVLDFSATWCGPCRMFAPTFEAAAARNASKASFVKVDVDSCREAGMAFGIKSIPQVAALMPDSTVVFAQPGLMSPEAFDAFLNEVLK